MDRMSLLLFLLPAALPLLASRTGPGTPPRRLPPDLSTVKLHPPGKRLGLPEGTLYVPDYLEPLPATVPLILHFQGPPVLTEALFHEARVRAVLYTSHLKGLSGAFEKPFRDPARLKAILREAEKELSALSARGRVKIGRLGITSFSAGYGAVREILKRREAFERVDYLLLADSLYASYLAPDLRVPPVDQMVDFLRFAQEAALGRKTLVVVHSHYLPAKYCGTWETADLLLAAVGGRRRKVRETTRRGVPIHYRFDRKGFHLLALDEKTARAHGDILYMIGELLGDFPPFSQGKDGAGKQGDL